MLSTIVGAAANIGGQIYTNKQNQKLTKEVNQMRLDAMREQTAKEFEYNSIGRQMSSAMAAGLHPSLMAEGGPTSASASSVPSLDAPEVFNPFSSAPSAGSSVASQMLQGQAIDVQAKQAEVQDFRLSIELLSEVSRLYDLGWTTPEVQQLLSDTGLRDKLDMSGFSGTIRDTWQINEFSNLIESSNIDLSTKKLMFSFLGKVKQAELDLLIAQEDDIRQGITESNQRISESKSRIDLNNASIADLLASANLSYEKSKEVQQAVKNMEEQWRSLSSQATIDEATAKRAVDLANATVDKLVHECKISENEALYWTWHQLMKYHRSGKVGPFQSGNLGVADRVAHKVPGRTYNDIMFNQ